MKTMIHGGDIYSARERFSGEILDFSANINPLGMPVSAVAAAKKAIEECVPAKFVELNHKAFALGRGEE